MQPMPRKKRFIYFLICVAVFMIAIPIIVLYADGYRLGEGLRLYQTGGIYIDSHYSGVEIALDGTARSRTGAFNKSFFIQNLMPRLYVVSAQKDSYHPWQETVLVRESLVIPVTTFMVPEDIVWRELEPIARLEEAASSGSIPNSEYQQALGLFAEAPYSIEVDPAPASSTDTLPPGLELFSEYAPAVKGNTAVWKEKTQLYARWLGDRDHVPQRFCLYTICENPTSVFTAPVQVSSFDFYPNRTDALVVAAGESVYAVQMRASPERTAIAIYSGDTPDVRVSGETVYVQDGRRIFRASFE